MLHMEDALAARGALDDGYHNYQAAAVAGATDFREALQQSQVGRTMVVTVTLMFGSMHMSDTDCHHCCSWYFA